MDWKKPANKFYTLKLYPIFGGTRCIRRFFSIHKGITFPDVIDATDFFKRIDTFTNVANPSHAAIKVETCAYPFTRPASYYLRSGSILFWKYKKPDYPYGHVALIWKIDPVTNEIVVVQQNLNPPVKRYSMPVLFSAMNRKDSKYAGVKLLPREYLTGISNLECVIHRL